MSEQYQFQSDEIIRSELLKTLEYYFSSKNLSKDDYLISQMDQDYYVAVEVIAKFNKIKNLTNDINFIKEIILQSSQLELDPETNTKVRSVNGKSGGTFQNKSQKQLTQTPTSSTQQRSVLILREVASEASMEKLIELFDNKEPLCPPCEKCESAGNDSWYVTFSNEEQAQRALQYLKGEVQTFMDRPIKARIKAHAMPRSNTSGVGFSQLALTPTSTPPPQQANNIPLPITPQSNQSFIQPPIYAFIPTTNFNPNTSPSNQLNHQINPTQASIIIQGPPNQPITGYDFNQSIYHSSNWQPTQQILNNPIPQTNSVYLIDVNHPINSTSPNNVNQSEDGVKPQQLTEQNINSSTASQNSSTNLNISNSNSPKSQSNASFPNQANSNLKQPSNYVYHTAVASPSNSPAIATIAPFASFNTHAVPPQALVPNSNHPQFTNPNIPQSHFVIQTNQHNLQNSNHQQAVNHAINSSGTFIQTNNLNQLQFTNPSSSHPNNSTSSQHTSAFYPHVNANLQAYDQSEQKPYPNQALAAPFQLPIPIHLPIHSMAHQPGNLLATNQAHQQPGHNAAAAAFAFFYNPAISAHQLPSNQNVIFNPIIPNPPPLQPQTVSSHNSNQTQSIQNNIQQFPSTSSSSSSSSPKLNNNHNNNSNNNNTNPNNNNNNNNNIISNNQNYQQQQQQQQQTSQRRSNTESSKSNQQNKQNYSGHKAKYNNQLNQNSNSSSSIGFNNSNNNRNHNHYNNSNYHNTNSHSYQHSYNNNTSNQNYYDSSSGISTSSALSSQSHTPIPTNNYKNTHGNDQQNYSHQDDLKRNKSPLIINSDLSFPPLNSSSSCGSSSSSSSNQATTNNSKNVTISLQNLPVNKQKNEEIQEAPLDPAIIQCYKSADFIPNSPTIIKSNTVIDSKSQEIKKTTSETLANILNQTNDHKHINEKHYNHTNNYHQRNKYDSYQRNTSNRNNSSNRNSNSIKKSNDQSNRHTRGSNSNQNIAADHHHNNNNNHHHHHHHHHNDQNNRKKNYEPKQKESISNSNENNNLFNNNRISLSLNTNEQVSYGNSTATTPGHSNEEEIMNSLNSCWNKKLTFAEIVQKAGSSASPSPTLMNKLNSSDENQDGAAGEFNSSIVQPAIAAD